MEYKLTLYKTGTIVAVCGCLICSSIIKEIAEINRGATDITCLVCGITHVIMCRRFVINPQVVRCYFVHAGFVDVLSVLKG